MSSHEIESGLNGVSPYRVCNFLLARDGASAIFGLWPTPHTKKSDENIRRTAFTFIQDSQRSFF
jgi:hypothetical protein